MSGRGRKPLDLPEDAIVRMYTEEMVSSLEIGRRMGCSHQPILRVLRERGVVRPKGNVPGKPQPSFRSVRVDIGRAVEMYVDERKPMGDIAEAFDCSIPSVRQRFVEHGVPIRHHNDTKRGVPQWWRNEIDIDRAIELYESGLTLAEVGEEFGVSYSVVAHRMEEQGYKRRSVNEYAKPTGPGHHRWRDDLADEERQNRRDVNAQKKWRNEVFERDGFACVVCGDDKGGNLNAHHLNSHDQHKAQRWDVENGATTCEGCHKGFHKVYGYGGNTAAQFREYVAQRNRRAA